MLEQLKVSKKVIGAKQVTRALKAGQVTQLFVAQNADPRVIEPIVQLCREESIPIEEVDTMSRLGALCGIAVGSAVAAIVSSAP